MKKLAILFTLLALLALTLSPTLMAQDSAECEADYTVQAGDWLSKIAEKYLGDVMAYTFIVDATNAKAAADSAYAAIDNPDLIETGWKLCIPKSRGAIAAPAEIIIRPPVLELEDGTLCNYVGEGAALSFGAQRLAYTCDSPDVGLLGDPLEKDGVLTAQKVTLGHNDNGFYIQSSETVAVTPSSAGLTLQSGAALAGDEKASSGLSEDNLKNASYTLSYLDEPITLQDGKYENAAERIIVTLGETVLGDLDGDGAPDAAVLLHSNTGGSGAFTDLALILDQEGQPVNVATEFLGDRVQIEKFFIEKAQIILDMIVAGPDDPMCCPTMKVSQRYQWKEGMLINLDGNVTASVLENTEYNVEYTADGKAKLVNGEYREQAAPGSAAEIVVKLAKSSAANDLNGDGKRDGAAVLVSDPGGSGTFYDLAATLMQGDVPVNVATTFLGDRIRVESVFIDAKGVIIVDMLTRKADDPMAAEPTEQATKYYTLQGDQLLEKTE